MAGRWRIAAALVLGGAGCGGGGACYNHQGCDADEVCWDGTCERTTNRSWTFDLVKADVGVVHPDGLAWDEDGTWPDLYVGYGLDWDVCTSAYVPDAIDPVWYQTCDFYVPDDGATFSVELWDADSAADELATRFVWEGPEAFTDLVRVAADPTRDPAPLVDPSGTVVLQLEIWPR
jgi:hypothetical protein